MRKDLTTDSTPPPDWSLSNETDAQLDRSSVRTGHKPSVKSMRLLRLPLSDANSNHVEFCRMD
jgi:hypothetical protein